MVGVACFLHLTHICIKHNPYNKHQRGFGRGEEVTEGRTAWVGQREGLSGWRVGTHTGQREAFLSALLSRELIEEDMGLCPILALSCSSEAPPETAWDLWPFAAVRKCLHLDNKIQGNSKGLKITVCMHNWGKKMDKKNKKNPNWISVEEQGAKTGCQVQKQGTVHVRPAHKYRQRSGWNTSKPPLQPSPWTHPYYHRV